MAEELDAADPRQWAETLKRLGIELDETLDELRALAHGVYRPAAHRACTPWMEGWVHGVGEGHRQRGSVSMRRRALQLPARRSTARRDGVTA